jgi:tetratricopeptide (TPR) repeat protein
MKQGQRTVRVFVSSTFRDMHEEREELVKRIFPQLRKLCESRGVTWGEVDLRWGVTDEQAAEGKVLPLCLAEIERCRPYFIGLLGERYGWVPESYPESLVREQPWLKNHLHHSVTELEIIHGVLKSPKMLDRSLFYFRDPKYLDSLPDEIRADFTADSIDHATRLSRLKQRIRDEHQFGKLKFAPRENYPTPKALGELILADFTQIIDSLYPPDQVPDPLDRDIARHEAYARSRRLAFIGREDLLKQMTGHVNSGGKPLVLVGESGCGKSALLAEWVARWRKDNPEDFVIQHYIGSSPDSSDWQGLIRRILGELKRAYNIPDELPIQPDALCTALNDWLAKAAGKGRIILVLDALNQLTDADTAHQLGGWLPVVFPANVQVLVSSRADDTLEAVRRRRWPELNVPLFDKTDIAPAARAYLKLFAKRPDDCMLHALETAPAATNALYLRTVLDELRQFGEHEELLNRTAWYLTTTDLPSLFDRVLTRWDGDFGKDPTHPDLVRRSLCLIACSRFGLAESELIDLLGKKNEQGNNGPLPRRHWTPFYLTAENSLSICAGLLNFAHDHLLMAVRRRWLVDEQVITEFRVRLADYFTCIPEPTTRKLDELPWLLARNARWENLAKLLSESAFFVAAWDHRELDVLRYWFSVEASSTFRVVDAYQQILKAPTADLSASSAVADLLMKAGHWQAAEAILTRLVSQYNGESAAQSLKFSLNSLAITSRYLGRLEDSLSWLARLETLCHDQRDEFGLQACLGNQGLILKKMGKLCEAAAKFREQVNICRRIGVPQGFVGGLNNYGNTLRELLEPHRALKLYEQAAQVAYEYGLLIEEGKSVGNQANTWLAIGDLERANMKFLEAAALQEQAGDRSSLFRTRLNRSSLLLRRRDYVTAEKEIHQLESLLRPVEDDELLAGLNLNKARLWLLLGRSASDAMVFARLALDLAVRNGALKLKQQAIQLLARLSQE